MDGQTSRLSYVVARFVPGNGAVDRYRVIETLRAEGLHVTEWSDAPDSAYSEHAHPQVEVRVVLAGEMTMTAGGKRFVLRPGDRIDFEADEAHSAAVGAAGVSYLAGAYRRDD